MNRALINNTLLFNRGAGLAFWASDHDAGWRRMLLAAREPDVQLRRGSPASGQLSTDD